MTNPYIPTNSEQYLANMSTDARLAVIIDQLARMGGGGLPITITQTVVVLAPAVSALLIAANANRRTLRWMVVGANPATVAPGVAAVVAGQGFNYENSSGVGHQGGADNFSSGDISTQAFSAISTLGTTVVVWEGQ